MAGFLFCFLFFMNRFIDPYFGHRAYAIFPSMFEIGLSISWQALLSTILSHGKEHQSTNT